LNFVVRYFTLFNVGPIKRYRIFITLFLVRFFLQQKIKTIVKLPWYRWLY